MTIGVDWSAPIVAQPVDGGITLNVSVDRSYHRSVGRTPVRLPVNLWTGGAPAGTWHFDDAGEACAGDDARYRICNG